jgi:hypothetical protein
MDHLRVLREKVGSLRTEIAELHELNEQYRRRKGNGTLDQVAHGQRHERLQGIQKELGRLADLGRTVHTTNQIREHDRNRLELMKSAKAS